MYGSQVTSWEICQSITIGKDICYATFWYEASKMAKEGVTATCAA